MSKPRTPPHKPPQEPKRPPPASGFLVLLDGGSPYPMICAPGLMSKHEAVLAARRIHKATQGDGDDPLSNSAVYIVAAEEVKAP